MLRMNTQLVPNTSTFRHLRRNPSRSVFARDASAIALSPNEKQCIAAPSWLKVKTPSFQRVSAMQDNVLYRMLKPLEKPNLKTLRGSRFATGRFPQANFTL